MRVLFLRRSLDSTVVHGAAMACFSLRMFQVALLGRSGYVQRTASSPAAPRVVVVSWWWQFRLLAPN